MKSCISSRLCVKSKLVQMCKSPAGIDLRDLRFMSIRAIRGLIKKGNHESTPKQS